MTKKEKVSNVPTWGLFHAIQRNHIQIITFLFSKYDLELDESEMFSYAQNANLETFNQG